MPLLLASPGLILIMAGLLIAFLPGRWRILPVIVAPIFSIFHTWQLPIGFSLQVDFMSYLLTPLMVHSFTPIFATVFAIAALGGGIFSLRQPNQKEIAAAYAYAGSAIGVTFAGDLATFFIFWEIMAVGSTIVIWSAGTLKSEQAGMRYAWLHFLGGVILMAGIIMHYLMTGSIEVTTLTSTEISLSTGLILLGILINAAAPPFSAWVADSYPTSSWSGAVFLSAFTTKTAVFALITLFPGQSILIPIGLFMVFYGIIYAMLENDMRRILVYSIVNQVGFMVTAIGIGTTMALQGAAAHAFCHIIYKGLLLMSAGSVLYQTGKSKCTDLGGLYHSMPVTAICGIVGALAISAFPLTSGFVSKSLITSSAGYEGMMWTWFLLTAASAGAFLYVGIKFPWFVFFQKDSGLRPKDPPFSMQFAMIASAILCILPGIFPQYLFQLLPTLPDYEPNTAAHFVTQTQLLLFSALAFFLLLPFIKRTTTISLDLDWLYRKPLLWIAKQVEMGGYNVRNTIIFCLQQLLDFSLTSLNRGFGINGYFSHAVPLGNTVTRTGALLCSFLILYFIMGE